MIVITNCFLESLLGGLKSAVGSVGKTLLSPISYGINSLLGQSEMQKYERQLSRNEAYQKEMIDYQNKANLKYNKDLTLFNNQQTKEMSQYMYDNYQSPKAQSLAYKQAGLNPYMLSSAGSFSPTASSSINGGSSAPSPDASYTRDAPISALDAMQYKNLETQTQYNESQANYYNELTEGVRLDNDKKRAEKPYYAQNAYNQARSYALGNDLTEQEINNIIADIDLKKVEKELKTVLTDKETTIIGNLLVDRAFAAASVEEKYKMMQVNYDIAKQKLSIGKATIAMLYANASFTKALESMTPYQKKEINQRIANMNTQNDILEFERSIKKNDSEWNNVKNFNQNVLGPILSTASTIISAVNPFSGLFSSKPNPIGFK